MGAPTAAAAAAKAGGLSWQTIALVLGTATATTGGSLAVHRAAEREPLQATAAASVELEQRVRALEDAQHHAEVAAAARDAHLDEQLGVIREALVGMRADVKALAARPTR
jgi:hypothetical protein